MGETWRSRVEGTSPPSTRTLNATSRNFLTVDGDNSAKFGSRWTHSAKNTVQSEIPRVFSKRRCLGQTISVRKSRSRRLCSRADPRTICTRTSRDPRLINRQPSASSSSSRLRINPAMRSALCHERFCRTLSSRMAFCHRARFSWTPVSIRLAMTWDSGMSRPPPNGIHLPPAKCPNGASRSRGRERPGLRFCADLTSCRQSRS